MTLVVENKVTGPMRNDNWYASEGSLMSVNESTPYNEEDSAKTLKSILFIISHRHSFTLIKLL